MTVLRTRVTSGNPPTAAQMLGFDITSWAEQGALGDLTSIATKENWDKVIPAALQKFSKYDGKWIAAPVNVHSTNWIWINKALYDKAGAPAPKDYDGFIAMLDKFKAAGVTPLAIAGQGMDEMTLLDSVTLSTGGLDFYKKAFVDLDQASLGSDTMKKIFERMVQLRGYADANIEGRNWDQATAMVIKGEAGVQAMGDWAKGEFRSANKKPGEDFVCLRFPGTQQYQWSVLENGEPVKLPVSGRFDADDGDELTGWALDGRGIAMKPLWEVAEHLASGALVPVLPDFPPEPVTLAVLYPHRALVPAKVRAFADHMVPKIKAALTAISPDTIL